MTNEELERAIDFLLKSQANLEANAAHTDEQIRQLTVRMDALADTQTNLVQVVTRHIEEQGRAHASMRATDAALARLSESLFASQARLGESLFASHESLRDSQESLRASQESQGRMNESLNAALVELAGRQSRTEESMARLAEAQASSERRMEALINIVEEGRGGGG